MSIHDPEPTGLEIAVLGMAVRFPGANTLEDFWRNLRSGSEAITHFTAEELETAGLPRALVQDPNYVKASPVLDDIEHFAASLFGYSPREAAILDPQQRLFLECVWEALETAGYAPGGIHEPVGVFAGSGISKYLLHNLITSPEVDWSMTMAIEIANDKDYLTTRVSYKLGLEGPSVNVETACSTSLVATHLACQALLSGECDMAVAGGAHLNVPHTKGYFFREGAHVSPDGRCRSFDERAAGTVFGSGVGAIVLKRLEDAVAAGDAIRAVILGSAINNDGSAKVGFAAPGVEGQKRVLLSAQAAAGVEPETITCVEAHGTATRLGDPIEVSALSQVFRRRTRKRGFCALGSVKANVGHLSAAAGMAGMIKTILALEHREIPPHPNFERPNPELHLEDSPFFVPTELTPWTSHATPRRAGVSSFGIGGTNAHLILEEAPELPPSGDSRRSQLLLLSADSESALAAVTRRLATHLESHPVQTFADVAFTMNAGRKPLRHRRALVARDRADALDLLQNLDPKRVTTADTDRRNPPVIFLLSGQGSQYPRMAAETYAGEATFRHWLDHCAELFEPYLSLDLRRLLYRDEVDAAAEALRRTRLTQPALFAVEYALARLWMEWGIQPEALLGHSIGEYVAACLAGVMRLEDAVRLVARRGELMQSLPAGAMLSVPLPIAEVEPRLGGGVSLAAVNGPQRLVVSGEPAAVAELEKRWTREGVPCRPLVTSHAFHSAMMDPVLEPFREALRQVELSAPEIPYLSNLTGTWIRDSEATDPDYWVEHLRRTVRFADGLEELSQEPGRVLLEVGPGRALATLARRHPARHPGQPVLSSLPPPTERRPDLEHLLETLGRLWQAGAEIDWRGFYRHERRRRLPLPTYPFERRRFWIGPGEGPVAMGGFQTGKRGDLSEWFYVPLWKPSALPLPFDPEASGAAARSWLIFADGSGLGEAVAERLAASAGRVVTVRPGDAFGRSQDGDFRVRPAERGDYASLLDELAADGGLPGHVVHLWTVTAGAGEPPGEDAAEAPLDLGFYSLVHLAQAFGKQGTEDPIRIEVLSNGLHQVCENDRLWPEKAALLGPIKTLPREYPNLRCRSLDIGPVAHFGEAPDTELVERIAAELTDGGSGTVGDATIVAYRGGHRRVQTWEPVPLDRAADQHLKLRSAGVYLITGGLGGLGLKIARYLAESVQAKLALVGRSALPEPEAWDEWLAGHDDGDSLSRKIRTIRELQGFGAEVQLLSADMSDPEQVCRTVESVRRRFGRVNGVVHAAGIAGGGVIQRKTREVAAAVLAPKVRGTRALTAALDGQALDFLLLFSSTTAVVSTFGQVDYCAANNVLDAFAWDLHRRRPELSALSINWGAWDEVGMAVETELSPGLRRLREPSGTPGAATVARGRPAGSEPPGSPGPEAEGGVFHPLLGRFAERSATRAVFVNRLGAPRDWVLAEHRIFDTPAVPGSTYLEMARAAVVAVGGRSSVELANVLFFTPLRMTEGVFRELRTVLEVNGSGYRFRVESRGGDGDGGWQEHAQGDARSPADGATPRTHDLEKLAARCDTRRVDVDRPFHQDGGFVYWGPRWQSLRRMELGQDEGLIHLELPDEFTADLETCPLHPALLDVATALSVFGEGDFLPLSYERVTIRRPLVSGLRCHLYNRRRSDNRETLTMDVRILDRAGLELVTIEGFTQKRVGEGAEALRRPLAGARGSARITEATAHPGASPAADAPTRSAGRPGHGIAPAEGIEALRRILSRFPGPQIVVSPRDLKTLLRRSADARGPADLADEEVGSGSRETHQRPDIQTTYETPRSALESQLSDLWQDVLGLDRVGIRDNFYELGGDSILGIQVVARARRDGLELSPNLLFEHLTIAELAEAMGDDKARATPAEDDGATRPPAAEPMTWKLPAELGERLARAAGEIEDVYPLTALQQGLLWHSLEAGGAGLYVESIHRRLEGQIDPKALEDAWREVLRRHPALRTAFVWEGVEEPLQVVFRSVDLEIAFHDWRKLALADRERKLREFLDDEGRRGFDLERAPLMRVSVLRSTEEDHHLLWSHHHLPLDGWSSGLVLQEVLALYRSFAGGEDHRLAPPRPFRDYVVWLQQQDHTTAEKFWRESLAGFDRPLELAATAGRQDRAAGQPGDDRREVRLSRAETARLEELASRHRVTLGALVEGAWAVLLGHLGNRRDVVFGITVSGRPAELEGVESIAGLFINTLPIRVDVDPGALLANVLQGLQGAQNRLLAFSHTPLALVQSWSEIPAGAALFESIFHFWNFPGAGKSAANRSHYRVRTHYPLLARAIPYDQMVLQVDYQRTHFEDRAAERILELLQVALRGFLEHPEAAVAAVLELLRESDKKRRGRRAEALTGLALDKLKRRVERPEPDSGKISS